MVVRSTLPEPNCLTVSTHADAAPGTVMPLMLKLGKDSPVTPSLRR